MMDSCRPLTLVVVLEQRDQLLRGILSAGGAARHSKHLKRSKIVLVALMKVKTGNHGDAVRYVVSFFFDINTPIAYVLSVKGWTRMRKVDAEPIAIAPTNDADTRHNSQFEQDGLSGVCASIEPPSSMITLRSCCRLTGNLYHILLLRK